MSEMNQMNQNEMAEMLLRRFRMVVPSKVKRCTRSAAEIRISASKINFNALAAAELGYPEYVCIMVSEDGRQIAVQSSEKNEYAFPFCRFDEEGKPKKEVVSIGNKQFIKAVRKQMGWKETGVYVTPAVRYIEGDMLLFDLSAAFIRTKEVKPTLQQAEGLDAYPPMSEILMKYRSIHNLPSAPSNMQIVEGQAVEVVSA